LLILTFILTNGTPHGPAGCRCAFSQAIFLQHGTIHALQGGNGIKLFKLPDIWIPLERERIESQFL